MEIDDDRLNHKCENIVTHYINISINIHTNTLDPRTPAQIFGC